MYIPSTLNESPAEIMLSLLIGQLHHVIEFGH